MRDTRKSTVVVCSITTISTEVWRNSKAYGMIQNLGVARPYRLLCKRVGSKYGRRGEVGHISTCTSSRTMGLERSVGHTALRTYRRFVNDEEQLTPELRLRGKHSTLIVMQRLLSAAECRDLSRRAVRSISEDVARRQRLLFEAGFAGRKRVSTALLCHTNVRVFDAFSPCTAIASNLLVFIGTQHTAWPICLLTVWLSV